MGTTAYFANMILNASVRAQSVTFPSTLYVALFSDDPAVSTTAELVFDDYARKTVTFVAPLDGQTRNAADVDFGTIGSDWGTISHYAIMDALTNGNMLYYEAFDELVSAQAEDAIKIPAGTLVLDLE